ncbi:ABC transporter permease [Schaalia sp. 19OD2882]|uniref:FtsX-like permease family protein n=1 Tax=Schaalia sp. 19OD2882 TaxID=2794089 RepID=UPI001C1ECD61|nr:ABC transporter permease [Schaalia sp. 19OD2882]QWW19839.1 ABC transporter permease [Schaalia sp. 19OD2882]
MTPRPLRLAVVPLRNIRAHLLRSMVLMLLVLAQSACALAGIVFIANLRADLDLARDRLGADVLVYPSAGFLQLDKACVNMLGTPIPFHRERSGLALLDTNGDIERVDHQIYLTDDTGDGQSVSIVGFDPSTDFTVAPWLDKGPEHVVPDGSVAVGADAVGTDARTVILFGKEWPIDSRLHRTGTELDRAVFVPISTLESVIAHARAAGVTSVADVDPRRDYSVALLRLHDQGDAESVTNWINLYIRRVNAVHSDTAVVGTSSSIAKHSGIISAVASATWVILLGAVGLAQSLMLNERRREMSVWRHVGASNGLVRRVMVREALIVDVVGALAGVALASVVLLVVPGLVPRPELLSPMRLVAASAGALALTVLVGWLSAHVCTTRTLKATRESMQLTA